MSMETLQLPLSPYDEGYTSALTAWDMEEEVLHFDGADHLSIDVPENVHDGLVERPDFIKGFSAGVELRRKLESIGCSVSKVETMEELLARSPGGSQ